MLPIEIFLALGLLLELVDRRQVDLAQPLDLLAGFARAAAPSRRRVASSARPAVVCARSSTRRRKLLEQRLAADLELLHREPHAVELLARLADPRFGGDPLARRARAAAHRRLPWRAARPRAPARRRRGAPARSSRPAAQLQPPLCSPAPICASRSARRDCVLRDLRVEPGEARQQRLVAGAPRLDAYRDLAGRRAILCGLVARSERAAARSTSRSASSSPRLASSSAMAATASAEPLARRPSAGLGGRQLDVELGELCVERGHAVVALLGARAQPVELRAQLEMRGTARRHARLRIRQQVLHRVHLLRAARRGPHSSERCRVLERLELRRARAEAPARAR